ncbi:MAG: YdcF family protein [Pseudomonadota bacterium]
MADSTFFLLSKIGWTLAKPDSWIAIGLIWAVLSFWRGRIIRAKRITVTLAVFVLTLTLLPLGSWIIAPIEAAYPPLEPPAEVDGIIVLGGFEDARAQALTGQAGVNDAAERLLEGLALARLYPNATVVFSSGSGDARRPDFESSNIALRHALALGFERERFVMETRSRNTVDNARNTLALVDIEPDETWLLVTSANHMPRSLGVFCAQGVSLTPYPVDYRSADADVWPRWALTGNLRLLNLAARESLGRAVYRATGRMADCPPA